MTIKQYKNIRSVIDNYDAFMIDLWGVIHDGVTAYPGVNECLSEMKSAGKKVIFLSNAPRRAFRAVEGLQRVGVPDDLYDHIITSGEATYEYLKASRLSKFNLGETNTSERASQNRSVSNIREDLRSTATSKSSTEIELGKKYYMIGPERDAGLLDGLDYQRVNSPAEAGFVIVTGFEEDSSTLEEKIPELQECLKYNLLMICANPDYVVVRQTGERALCAGAMGEKYQAIGGKIMQFGKPYPDVYKKCLSLINGIALEKIAAIGDNLDTDIKGANNFGIDSYLIAGGILGEELGIKHGELPEINRLEEMCKKSGNIPTAVLPAFVW